MAIVVRTTSRGARDTVSGEGTIAYRMTDGSEDTAVRVWVREATMLEGSITGREAMEGQDIRRRGGGKAGEEQEQKAEEESRNAEALHGELLQ